MFTSRYLTSIIIVFSLVSCFPGKQLDPPAYYKNPASADTTKLRFDGFYTTISDTSYKLENYTAILPVFFTVNNKMSVSHGGHIKTDSSLFSCAYYKKYLPKGVYIIEGNKISAFVPVAVAKGEGAWYPIYRLHFSGTIINKEFITNFRAVPPFPKKVKKRDINWNTGIFKEHDLKFVRADSIKCLTP